MKIKWTLEFDFPIAEGPIIRDDSRWLNHKVVTVEGLNFINGLLAYVVCDAQENSRSHSPVVYHTDIAHEDAGSLLPERKKLDALLPRVLSRAKAEALVSASRHTGLPDPFTAVRSMLQAQEEFIHDVDGIYEALNELEAAHGAAAEKK